MTEQSPANIRGAASAAKHIATMFELQREKEKAAWAALAKVDKMIKLLERNLADGQKRLAKADPGSPLHSMILAQIKAAEDGLKVMRG